MIFDSMFIRISFFVQSRGSRDERYLLSVFSEFKTLLLSARSYAIIYLSVMC